MRRLDTSKPYGVVCGAHPARYEQDGRFFNADQLEIDETGTLVEEGTTLSDAKAATKPRRAASVKAAVEEPKTPTAPLSEQLEAQLGAQLGADASFE